MLMLMLMPTPGPRESPFTILPSLRNTDSIFWPSSSPEDDGSLIFFDNLDDDMLLSSSDHHFHHHYHHHHHHHHHHPLNQHHHHHLKMTALSYSLTILMTQQREKGRVANTKMVAPTFMMIMILIVRMMI